MANTQGTDYSKPTGAFAWVESNWKNIVVIAAIALISFFLGGWIL